MTTLFHASRNRLSPGKILKMSLKARAEAVVAAVNALGDEGEKLFTAFDPETLVSQADDLDQASAAEKARPLHGVFVTIKDLFDQAGHVTTAASQVLKDLPAADRNAEAVQRLIEAGALIVGRTTMSELAYSGVGLNPHYGTPGSIFDATRIPGGSTSGGALTVAHGLADIALGSDTGGSIRIPAAVNGLYGFKPCQKSISAVGVRALAPSFDTVGLIASTLELCERAFDCLRISRVELTGIAGTSNSDEQNSRMTSRAALRFAQPVGAFTNEIDSKIHADFQIALGRIQASGHTVETIDLSRLNKLGFANRVIASVEAHAIYTPYLDQLDVVGDPRVLARIRFSESLSDSEIQLAYEARSEAIEVYRVAMAAFDALLAPTLAIETPTLSETQENFDHINMMMLRNPSVINLTDGCAISLPFGTCSRQGCTAPIALMVCASDNHDERLLAIARKLDALNDPPGVSVAPQG